MFTFCGIKVVKKMILFEVKKIAKSFVLAGLFGSTRNVGKMPRFLFNHVYSDVANTVFSCMPLTYVLDRFPRSYILLQLSNIFNNFSILMFLWCIFPLFGIFMVYFSSFGIFMGFMVFLWIFI